MRIKFKQYVLTFITFTSVALIFYTLPSDKRRYDAINKRLPNSRIFAKFQLTISKSAPCIALKKKNSLETTNALLFRNVMLTQNDATLATQENSLSTWNFNRGFMKVICPSFNFTHGFMKEASSDHKDLLSKVPIVYTNGTGEYLSKQIDSMAVLESAVFVVRQEYANPYWVLIDMIDIYLTLNQTGVDPKKTTAIWGDNFTSSVVDQLWDVVFKGHIQVSPAAGKQLLIANQLTLRPDRKHSIALRRDYNQMQPLYGFRNLVYQNLGVVPNHFSCDAIRVLVVWRRDYVNHPRNPKGKIYRKVDNEDEVVATMRSLSYVLVTEVQLDRLSVVEQIRLMSESDVFWGVHGAGHAMSIFLPSHRVVVELMPTDQPSNWHMGHLSKLSGHKHLTEKVRKSTRASDGTYYTVPPSTVKKTLEDARRYLCD